MALPEQLTILVVEDDPTDVVFLRRNLKLLTESRVDIVHVQKEEDVLATLNSRQFDLMFLDNSMIRKTGVEILREIRQAGHRLGAILFTGLFDESLRAELDELQCDAVLEKGDATPETLKGAMLKVIDRTAVRIAQQQ